MKLEKKDATVADRGPDDAFPGSFEVILSAPTKDRDGDTLLPTEWKQPLPDHINFDMDHQMSVMGTVGSGVPSLLPDGRLHVLGNYSSLPHAQAVRTLVKEGHINRTSVAFMTEPSETKDGKQVKVRELLNGAFVSIPSNREAVVLSAKSGARNSKTDAAAIQGIHDSAADLGAACSIDGQAGKAFVIKDGTDSDDDPAMLAQACDAALDQALILIGQVDPTTLPEPIQQAIGLITAAEEAIDSLLDVMNIPDPDDEGDSAGKSVSPASGVRAPVAGKAATPADSSKAIDEAGARYRAIQTYVNAPERG